MHHTTALSPSLTFYPCRHVTLTEVHIAAAVQISTAETVLLTHGSAAEDGRQTPPWLHHS